MADTALNGALSGLFSGLFRLVVSNRNSSFPSLLVVWFGAITIAIGSFCCFRLGLQNVSVTRRMAKTWFVHEAGQIWVRFRGFSTWLKQRINSVSPLVLLLLYSVPFASPVGSVALAVLFGFGTTLSPYCSWEE